MPRADRSSAGFSLIEVVVVLLVVAVLTLVAWPSLQAFWLRARRADGVVALLQLQQQQARWRADHPRYASHGELGGPGQSADGHYRLAVASADSHGFELQATAQGAQRADRGCAHLHLVQAHADTRLGSRTAQGAPNPEPENRRCWGR